MNLRTWYERHIGRSDDFRTLTPGRLQGPGGVLAGACLGSAVGAAAGYAVGYRNLLLEKAEDTFTTHPVKSPVLVGARLVPATTLSAAPPADGGVGQARIEIPAAWEPVIEDRVVSEGVSEYRKLEQTEFGPIASSLVGMIAGALVGVALGTLANWIAGKGESRKTITRVRPDRKALAFVSNLLPVAGGGLGAAAGWQAGRMAGAFDGDRGYRSVSVQIQPRFGERVIGWIPSASDLRAQELVDAEGVLRYESLPQEAPYKETGEPIKRVAFAWWESSETRVDSCVLGPFWSGVLAAGLGAGVGVLAGVGARVLLLTTAVERFPADTGVEALRAVTPPDNFDAEARFLARQVAPERFNQAARLHAQLLTVLRNSPSDRFQEYGDRFQAARTAISWARRQQLSSEDGLEALLGDLAESLVAGAKLGDAMLALENGGAGIQVEDEHVVVGGVKVRRKTGRGVDR